MNIRQLACFVAVVDEGSFTRGARAIGIAQPSLSQHIRALEEELNGRVLERLPRGIALTPGGTDPAPGGTGRGARRRARPPRRARRTRARGRRARDRNRPLDGRGPAAALHPQLARALPGRRHPPARVSSPLAARGRCRAGRRRLRDRPAPGTSVGRPARGDRVGGVRDRRPADGSARRSALDPRSRSSPTANGCCTTRITGSPGSSRRPAAAPGSARAARCARHRRRVPRGSRRPGSGRRSSPTTSCCRGSRDRCCASSRG